MKNDNNNNILKINDLRVDNVPQDNIISNFNGGKPIKSILKTKNLQTDEKNKQNNNKIAKKVTIKAQKPNEISMISDKNLITNENNNSFYSIVNMLSGSGSNSSDTYDRSHKSKQSNNGVNNNSSISNLNISKEFNNNKGNNDKNGKVFVNKYGVVDSMNNSVSSLCFTYTDDS